MHKGPMNVSTLQRNQNGQSKEMTFSISRQWRFKRYSNLKLGYLKNSLVKTSCFPFSWPIRDTVPKKLSRVRSVYSNFVRKYGVLNITKLSIPIWLVLTHLTHPVAFSSQVPSAPSRCTGVHSYDPGKMRWTQPRVATMGWTSAFRKLVLCGTSKI